MSNPFKVGDLVQRRPAWRVHSNNHPSHSGEVFRVKSVEGAYLRAGDGAKHFFGYVELVEPRDTSAPKDDRWFVYVYDHVDPSQCIVLRTEALTRKVNAWLDTLLPQVNRIEAIKGDTRLVYLGTAASEHGAWEPKT